MSILLTGLTGEVGSRLGSLLQVKERMFCLVRNGKQRVVNGKLKGVPVSQIINADIASDDFCGINLADIDFLKKQKITKIIHLAASVKFDEDLSKEIWTTNYIGTKNVLSLTKELGIREFHYVSTAYASTTGRNPYEKSKAAAEKLVKESMITYSIYRLGIVIGDSKTGHIKAFNGYYGFFIPVYVAVKRYREKKGLKGTINLPLYIDCSFDSTLNLVPIDWVTRILTELIKLPCQDEAFYIVHSNPPRVQWVMEEGFRTIGVEKIRYIDYRDFQPEQNDRILRIIQKGVNNELARFRPYVTEEKDFSLKTTQKYLDGKYKDPPQITSELLAMLLEFAIKKEFGRT